MNDMSTDQLDGIVLRFVNIAALLPQYKGRIGLDVRIEHGRLRIGQKIQLLGPETTAEFKVVGIEAMHDPKEPKVIRIHCDSPVKTFLPDGPVEGWRIVSE